MRSEERSPPAKSGAGLVSSFTTGRSRDPVRRSFAPDGDRLDDDVLDWPVALASARAADRTDDVHAFDDFAEDGVAIVEVRRRPERHEELSAVGIRAAIGHREDAGLVMTSC